MKEFRRTIANLIVALIIMFAFALIKADNNEAAAAFILLALIFFCVSNLD